MCTCLLLGARVRVGSQPEQRKEERGLDHSGPFSLPAGRRAHDRWEFQVTHAGREGVMNRVRSSLLSPHLCFLVPFIFSLTPCRPVLLTRALTLLPLLSLTICSSLPWLVPNLRLTSDRKLGEVPLVGVSFVPGLRLAALRAGDPYGLPWGCKVGCRSCPPPHSQRGGRGLSSREDATVLHDPGSNCCGYLEFHL